MQLWSSSSDATYANRGKYALDQICRWTEEPTTRNGDVTENAGSLGARPIEAIEAMQNKIYFTCSCKIYASPLERHRSSVEQCCLREEDTLYKTSG